MHGPVVVGRVTNLHCPVVVICAGLCGLMVVDIGISFFISLIVVGRVKSLHNPMVVATAKEWMSLLV